MAQPNFTPEEFKNLQATGTVGGTPVIPVDTINQPVAPINLPTPIVGSNVPVPMGQVGAQVIAPTAPVPVDIKATPTTLEQSLAGMFAGETGAAPASVADAYTQAQAQSGIIEKQQAVNEYSAQLNAINAELAANKLKQGERLAGMGEISGTQAKLERDAAIRALPIAAQLSAAQGNLTAAQSNLETLFRLKAEDISNKHNYNKEIRVAAREQANADQKVRLDAAEKIADQKFELQKLGMSQQSEWAKLAIENGQSALAVSISILDPKSPTFASDLAREQAKVVIKPTVTTDIVKLEDGSTVVIDKTTGNVIKNLGGSATGITEGKISEALNVANSITNALNDPAFNTTFGIQGMLFRNVPQSPEYALAANVDNIIANLALAARGKLKGQGTVSDFEGKMLKDAQTALRLNMNPEQAKKEFTKIKGAIRTSSGLTSLVKITDPKTGETNLIESGSAGIQKAFQDGLTIEYQ